MARYTGAVCRLCRRENQKLFLKGTRCFSEKCALSKRAYAPGQHGQARKKMSEYGVQLREKQKTRRYYGVLEGQFANYYEMAVKKAGITGENLLIILESRLDNIVYRLGWATSRPEARQLVRHGHFEVNGQKANIPSILLKAGDTITIKDKSRSSEKIKAVLETTDSKVVPMWLSLDKNALSASIVRMPTREEIDLEVEEHLIVELYSK
ncbi:MAG: 30S ribosomal protein S4 [Clostridia bacterium]|nr:30S ribosomal protein S4 [Clostridia bacterium]MBQ7950347.1 30S ribosomal protein S4 [Clostridia bacterium]